MKIIVVGDKNNLSDFQKEKLEELKNNDVDIIYVNDEKEIKPLFNGQIGIMSVGKSVGNPILNMMEISTIPIVSIDPELNSFESIYGKPIENNTLLITRLPDFDEPKINQSELQLIDNHKSRYTKRQYRLPASPHKNKKKRK